MRRVLLVLALILVVVVGCAPKATPAPQAAAPSSSQAATEVASPKASLEPWQVEWEKVVDAAKKEGSVVVYSTAGAETRAVLMRAFKEKYGISAEVITAKGAEVSQKLFSERRAGLYMADIYTGGSTTIVNELKPGGVLDPLEPVLILPEVTDTKLWYSGRLPWTDTGHYIFAFMATPSPSYAINTEQVKLEEAKSYKDLLNPKWKGKMTLNDPTAAGTGLKWFGIVSSVILDIDYMRQLVKQEPFVIRDQRMQVEWMAKAKYPIAISPKSDPFAEFLRAGAPIKHVEPMEGGYLTSASGNLALLNRAPHPNAAKVFVNWLLSKEGQALFSRAMETQTARMDVSVDFLDVTRRRDPNAKYFTGENEEFLLKQPEQAKVAKEIFGALIR